MTHKLQAVILYTFDTFCFRRPICRILFLVVLFAIPGLGQAMVSVSPVFKTLLNISKNVKQIEEKNRDNKTIHEHAVQIDTKVSELTKVFADSKKTNFSNQYLTSLVIYDEALTKYANSSSDRPDKLVTVLQGLLDDLNAKLVFAKASRGSSGSEVSVTVKTIRNNKEESGFIVWFVPRAWLDTRAQYQRFDRASSPSIMDLAPGNYFIWAEKGDFKSPEQPLVLGADKKSRREIEIVIQ